MKFARALNIALCLVLAGIWAFIALTRPDQRRRNFRWIPQMEDPLAFETQKRFLPGAPGEAVGAAAPGTVARGFLPFPYKATPEDADRAGRELSSPLKSTPENLRSGARIFAAYCFPCHGPGGNGDGPVTRRGVPAPPSLLSGNMITMADGKIYHIISLGRGNMSAYASQLERGDRWLAILHVRALQAAAKAAKGKAK
ncbi:MAG: cytochrome c [Elusimicrobia bacterium]|nr:cytochrome c [Elusimicrobiota bacterium]